MNLGTTTYQPRPFPFEPDPVRPNPLGPDPFGLNPLELSRPLPFSTEPTTRAVTGFEISPGDRRTLKRAVAVIKAARHDIKSGNPKVSAPAQKRLADVLCYVAGFLDGRGHGQASVNGGFQSVVQSSLISIDPEAQLDEFEKSLISISESGETRFWNYVAGVALIAIGVGLRQV